MICHCNTADLGGGGPYETINQTSDIYMHTSAPWVLSEGKSVAWSLLAYAAHICHRDSCVRYDWKSDNRHFTSRQLAEAAWRGLLPVCEQCPGKGTWPQLQMTPPPSHAPLCHSPMPQNPVGIWETDRELKINILFQVSLPVKNDALHWNTNNVLFSAAI